MKKLNNKGFTLAELLAVITILGVLMAIAVGATLIHLQNTRKQAMETIASTSYDGMVMYMMDNNVMLNTNESKTVTIAELYAEEKIEEPKDPYKEGGMCEGTVTVKNNTTSSTVGLEDYKYTITVKCAGNHEVIQTYPKG